MTNDDFFYAKKRQKFECKKCDFVCSKKSDYERHLNTRKHKNDDQMMTNDDLFYTKKRQKTPKQFTCECGKIYKYKQGLSCHKQKCDITNTIIENTNNMNSDINFNKEIVIMVMKQNQEIMKQNQELQTQMSEIIKNGTHNTNINSNNSTFNLNLFLNEQCKDAMNIMDFVNSLKLQLCDLENVGKLGFVNGISNIIVKSLKEMDIYKRPVHCTDTKRETLYIKDEDHWSKDDNNNNKLRNVIKHVAHKNSKMLSDYKAKHPDCMDSSSKYSEQYNKLIIESMGGSGNADVDSENKIIKNIAKEVIIDK
jgi:hypothetical protein